LCSDSPDECLESLNQLNSLLSSSVEQSSDSSLFFNCLISCDGLNLLTQVAENQQNPAVKEEANKVLQAILPSSWHK
jgi:hypothetical protein